MTDNVGYTPGVGATVAADEIGGVLHQRIKLVLGADGVSDGDVSATNPIPITTPAPIDVTGSVSVSNFPATQPVSGSVSVSNFPATQPVSGTVSVGNFPATQPVSGTVSVGNFPATQNVNIVGGSSGNAAAGTTGAAVPASADYIGYNSGGNLVGVSSANPLPVDIGAVGTLEVTDANAELLLMRILNYLNAPQGYDKSLQRQRATVVLEPSTLTTVTTVTTVSTVTTCSTVTNLSTIDTLQGRIQVYGANLSAWADCVRSRIT
jgi:hypothetical protein